MLTKAITAVKEVFLHFFEYEPPALPVEAVTQPNRTRDCTRLSRYEYDYIRDVYNNWKQVNEGRKRDDRVRVATLVAEINATLELNKSHRFYQRVWMGHMDREELAPGTPLFKY